MFILSYFQKADNNKFYVFALAFGLFLFLSGCKSAQLQELENLVSIIQPTTGREVSRHIQDTEAALTGFGPTYAKIRVEYEPINNHTKEDLYDEIVAILEKNNWEGEECDACRTNSFIASPMHTIVLIRPDENLVSISVRHPTP